LLPKVEKEFTTTKKIHHLWRRSMSTEIEEETRNIFFSDAKANLRFTMKG
jgi:hypothetical protein